MIAQSRPESRPPSSQRFLGIGIRVAGAGTVVMAIYFLIVSESPIPGLRDALSWMVPVGVVSWILAIGLFTAAVAVRGNADMSAERLASIAGAGSGDRVSGQSDGWIAAARVEIEKRFPSVFQVEWNLQLLRSLDGAMLVRLSAAYFDELGFRTQPQCEGTSGIDICLFDEDETQPTGAVECLPWGDALVGVRAVRKFHEALSAEGIGHGVMIATGTFSEEAMAYAAGKTLELIHGELFLEKLAALPAGTSDRLLQDVTRPVS